ncbi:hypothetical protein Tco_0870462 [Tanacetum coccineum]
MAMFNVYRNKMVKALLVVELILTKIVPPPMATFIVTIFKNLFPKQQQLISIKEIPVTEHRLLIKFDLLVFLPFKTKEITKTFTTKTGGTNYNQSQIYRPPINQPPVHQAPPYQAPAPQTQGVSKDDFQNYIKANDAVMRNMQNQTQNMQNQMTNLTDLLTKFMNSNTASTSGSGSLPSNTVANPKSDLKAITTRSGVSYQGPTIPTTSSSPPKVVERETEVTKDTVPPTNNGSTKDVQPPVVQVQPQVPNSEPVVAPVSAPMPNPKPSIPYPSRRNDERRREKANDQIEKFYEIFIDLSFEISLTDALIAKIFLDS